MNHKKYIPTDIIDCNTETENVWEYFFFNAEYLADYIKQNGYGSVLFSALWLNGPEFVKQYLDKYSKHMDMNAMNIFGHTFLTYAIVFSNRECVDYILEHGADVNKRIEINGNPTPLEMAITRPLIVEKLLKKGANTNITINKKPIKIYLHNEIVHELKKGQKRDDILMKRLMKTYYLIEIAEMNKKNENN
jgi:hypothetical protein